MAIYSQIKILSRSRLLHIILHMVSYQNSYAKSEKLLEQFGQNTRTVILSILRPFLARLSYLPGDVNRTWLNRIFQSKYRNQSNQIKRLMCRTESNINRNLPENLDWFRFISMELPVWLVLIFFFDYVRFISIQKRIIESRSNVTMHMHNTPHFENHMNLNMNLLTFISGGIGVINRVIGCLANIISKVKSGVSTKISIDITWYLQSSKIFFSNSELLQIILHIVTKLQVHICAKSEKLSE